MKVSEKTINALLDDAFRILQHDTGELDPEYVWQRTRLQEAFRSTLRARDDSASLPSARDMAAELNENTHRIDADTLTGQYWQNLLESAAGWFESRSSAVWAREGGYRGLMRSYALDLREVRRMLGVVRSRFAGDDDRAKPNS